MYIFTTLSVVIEMKDQYNIYCLPDTPACYEKLPSPYEYDCEFTVAEYEHKCDAFYFGFQRYETYDDGKEHFVKFDEILKKKKEIQD